MPFGSSDLIFLALPFFFQVILGGPWIWIPEWGLYLDCRQLVGNVTTRANQKCHGGVPQGGLWSLLLFEFAPLASLKSLLHTFHILLFWKVTVKMKTVCGSTLVSTEQICEVPFVATSGAVLPGATDDRRRAGFIPICSALVKWHLRSSAPGVPISCPLPKAKQLMYRSTLSREPLEHLPCEAWLVQLGEEREPSRTCSRLVRKQS